MLLTLFTVLPTHTPTRIIYCFVIISCTPNMDSRRETKSLSLFPICPRLHTAMKINKRSSSNPVRRTVPLHTVAFESKCEEPILQHIIAPDVVPNRGTSSSPIQVSRAVPIEEELEELKLRHLYESATWRMFYRIAASRRSDSGSESLDGSFLEINAQIIQDEDLLTQPRRLARRSARKVSFSSNKGEGFSFDEFPEERHLILDENDEGVFHLDMES